MTFFFHPDDDTRLHMPLEKLDRCSFCGRDKLKLRVCGSCGEVLYCSEQCQKGDWKTHKMNCSNTVRIDLETYYPFLAALQYTSRMMMRKPDDLHPALERKILNSPNPGTFDDIMLLPDGSEGTRVVLLGDKIPPHECDTPLWWPTARSPRIRNKFMRRIMAEGHVLPVVVALTLSLVAQIYSAPSDRYGRLRLQSKHSPIADIGIAKGPIRVTSQNRLSYIIKETGEFILGQDPKEHMWMYFVTLDGHEYIMDCAMLTLNMPTGVDARPYAKPVSGLPPHTWIPCFFYGREMEKMMPLAAGWKPKERFSVLRNMDLRRAVNKMMRNNTEPIRGGPGEPVILEWMEKVAGRTCTPAEKENMLKFFEGNSLMLRLNVISRTYLEYPKTAADVGISVDLDPDQDLSPDVDYEKAAREQERYLKSKTKKLRRGQISPKQWDRALDRWLTLKREQRIL